MEWIGKINKTKRLTAAASYRQFLRGDGTSRLLFPSRSTEERSDDGVDIQVKYF